jgi:hypothetical protein
MEKEELIADFFMRDIKTAVELIEYLKGLSLEQQAIVAPFLSHFIVKKGISIPKDSTEEAEFNKYIEMMEEAQEKAEEKKQQLFREQIKNSINDKFTELTSENDKEKQKENIREIQRLAAELSFKSNLKLNEYYNSATHTHEIKTYNPDQDYTPQLFAGITFPNGTASYIGARTGRGKTTAMINLTREALSGGRKVLFITLEMSCRQLTNKLILSHAYATAKNTEELNDITTPYKAIFKLRKEENTDGINRSLIAAVKASINYTDDKLDNKLFHLVDGRGQTQDTITDLIRSQESGTVVFIDYLQRVPNAEGERFDNYMRIKKISDNLINAVVSSNVVLIAAAQLNRMSGKDNNGADTFTDASFRESGDIEQDAHNALGIGWDGKKEERFIEVLKTREGGHVGLKYDVDFNGAYSFMRNTEERPKEEKGTRVRKKWVEGPKAGQTIE